MENAGAGPAAAGATEWLPDAERLAMSDEIIKILLAKLGGSVVIGHEDYSSMRGAGQVIQTTQAEGVSFRMALVSPSAGEVAK